MTILLESLPVAGMVHLRISVGRDFDHLAVMGYLVLTPDDFRQFARHCETDTPYVKWGIVPQILPCRDDTPAPVQHIH